MSFITRATNGRQVRVLLGLAVLALGAAQATADLDERRPKTSKPDPSGFYAPPTPHPLPWIAAPQPEYHTVQEGGSGDERAAPLPDFIEKPTLSFLSAFDVMDVVDQGGGFDTPVPLDDLGLSLPPGGWSLDLDAGTSGADTLAPPHGAVPGPGAWPLLGLAALARRRRRRRA